MSVQASRLTRRLVRAAGFALLAALAAGCTDGLSVIGGPLDAAAANDLGADGSGARDGSMDAARDAMDATVDASRCGPSQMLCGTLCVSVLTDPGNCGACGLRCNDTEACAGGTCRPICPGGQVACAVPGSDGGVTACVLTATDLQNCGACGHACPAGQVCSNGMCGSTCAELFATCSNASGPYCADLTRDPANCGRCGGACAPGQTCDGRRCITACAPGLTPCALPGDGGVGDAPDAATGPLMCTDLQTDRGNCGACGTTCPAGRVCDRGSCVVTCSTGATNCNGSCRDLQTDRANCGACGAECAAGQVCSAGMCVTTCGSGESNCSGSCRDLQNDRANCGACGTTCPSGQVCTGGSCQLSCASGLSDAPARAATCRPTARTAAPAAPCASRARCAPRACA